MNGSKLLIIGVLVGFGGGMAAAIGMKLARTPGKTADPVVEASGTEAETATPTAVADASVAPPASETPAVEPAASATITPFDRSPRPPAPTPRNEATPRVSSDFGSPSTPRPVGTKKLAMVKGTPVPNAIDEMPVEGAPASITFGKSGSGNAITKIVEERHNDTSLLRIEITGKARYKILQLPKRHELWIDFEETEVPGGEKISAGSNVHVTEVRARTFAEGPGVARVVVKLANEGQFAVFPGKGTGEADGMLEIMLGP